MVNGLYGPVLLQLARRTGDLPVLVHVASQTQQSLAFNAAAVLPSSSRNESKEQDADGSLFSFPVGLFDPYNMPVYPGALRFAVNLARPRLSGR
jgi:hypothetical protein